MSLAEKLQKDLVDAMRAKDELRLSVLRMIKSALKYKETEKIRPLEEAEILQVLQTLVKQRKESIEQFTKGGRQDLADKEIKELAIVECYLPAGATAAEMDAAVAKAIAETGASSIKQMGAVVKAARAHLEGRTVDGKALSDLVRERLSKLTTP
ncbi:MAG: GatB/YqeY domain-containing protein [Acidobacteriia bacterium]|nr:GatB/YqeY domain-containing protein [Terriglobia bacterium]